MCSRGNVQSGKYPLGEMSGRGNVQSEKCPLGEIAARGYVWSGKCQVGEVSVGELTSRGCVNRGSVGQGKVQSGKCLDSIETDPSNGNPFSYFYYIALFKEAVENKGDEPKGRLSWLIKFTKRCFTKFTKELNQHYIQLLD